MANVERDCLRLDSQDKATWDDALAIALTLCAKSVPPVRDIVLLIHTKGQLKTALAGHLGAAQAKALDKGDALNLPNGGSLRLETLRASLNFRSPTVVIAYFADMRMLDQLDALSEIAGIVAVPNSLPDADPWIVRWSPRVHGQAAPASGSLINDPKVEGALTTLTKLVNRGPSTLHPSDKQTIQEVLKILRAKGHAEPPANIQSWAIKNGWKPKMAEVLAALAGKAWALKSKPSLTGIHDPDGRYGRW